MNEEILKAEAVETKADVIVGISRGGLIPAAIIAMKNDKPLVAIYIDKNDIMYLDRFQWIEGKHILLVDDIIRTGKTIIAAKQHLMRYGAERIDTFTLYDTRNRVMPWDYHEND